jgi:hypothetical protein
MPRVVAVRFSSRDARMLALSSIGVFASFLIVSLPCLRLTVSSPDRSGPVKTHVGQTRVVTDDEPLQFLRADGDMSYGLIIRRRTEFYCSPCRRRYLFALSSTARANWPEMPTPTSTASCIDANVPRRASP